MDSREPKMAVPTKGAETLVWLGNTIKSECRHAYSAISLPERYRTGVLLILVSCLLYFNWTGQLSEYVDQKKFSPIATSNLSYLEQAEQQAFKTYLLLAEFNSGLALLQSSRAGISTFVEVNVQLGSELKQVTSLVEKSTLVSLISMGVLFTLKLLHSFFQWLSPLLFTLLLGLAFIYLTISFVMKSKTKVSRIFGVTTSTIMLIFICVHLLFPLSIFMAQLTEKKITSLLSNSVHSNYDSVQQQILGASKKMSVKHKVESAFNRYEQAVVSIPEKVSMLAKNFIQHLVTTLFNTIVFPLGYFYVLLVLSRRILEHSFDLSKPMLLDTTDIMTENR